MSDVHASAPHAVVEVWSQDEARIGLSPIVRRIWAKRGSRPRATNHHRYAWRYAYGFVHPASGRTWWLIFPTVRTSIMSLALRAFAAAQGVGPNKQIILVLDGAGWHTSAKLDIPPGIHIVRLPAYTPELQPAERLWPLLHEPVANRTFADISALEAVLVNHCATLSTQEAVIKGRTNYHWWPKQ